MSRVFRIERRWAIAIALHLVMAIGAMGLFTKGAFVPALSQEFGYSQTKLSLLFSINTTVGCGVALVVGWCLARNYDFRVVLTIPLLILGIGNFVIANAHGYAGLVTGYVLTSTYSMLSVATPVIIGKWFTQRRGLAMGLGLTGSTTAGVLLAPVISLIVQHAGWRAGYMAIGSAILLCLPALVLLTIRNPPETPPAAAVGSRTDADGITLKEGLRTPAFWLLLTAYFAYIVHSGGYLIYFVSALKERGFSLTDASLVMSVLFLLAAVSKFLFGHMADRKSPARVAVGSYVAATVGLVILASTHSQTGLVLFTILYGLSYSVPLVLLPMLTIALFGRRHFAAFDSVLMVGALALGGWAGPVLIGVVYDHAHSYDAAFLTLALAPALGGIALMLALRLAGRRPDGEAQQASLTPRTIS